MFIVHSCCFSVKLLIVALIWLGSWELQNIGRFRKDQMDFIYACLHLQHCRFSSPICSVCSHKHTHTRTLWHSGWSVLYLTPDVRTTDQLPHIAGNFTCQSSQWTAPSHFLSFLFSYPLKCMYTPMCTHLLPCTQASHCHPIKCLHVGWLLSTAASVNTWYSVV